MTETPPDTLRLASLIDATEAEGPGLRFAIWAQGCTLGCPGCCNPHYWSKGGGREWTVDDLMERILGSKRKRPSLEGVSLIGGEPFEQDAPMAALAARIRAAGLTVMAYTGYRLQELAARGSELVNHCDLLVDGRYEESLRTTARRFVGSSNQGLHFLTDAYAEDDPRFAEPNTAEIRFNDAGEVQVVGFPFEKVMDAFGPRAMKKLKTVEP